VLFAQKGELLVKLPCQNQTYSCSIGTIALSC